MPNTVRMIQHPRYSIAIQVIQEQARHLIHKRVISPQQPIFTLCKYIPASEWTCVEYELEENNFLLRDRIADLIGNEQWEND